jgi:predicted phage terminase large subunit-like protein
MADYTAGVKCGLTLDGTLVIGHLVHGRWETGSSSVIHNTALSDGLAVMQGIEVVGAALGTFQSLQADPRLANIPMISVPVDRDKITRAMPLLARAEQGKLVLVQGTWNQTFIDELCAFPESDHDDIVDATSGGLNLIAQPNTAIVSPNDFVTLPAGILGGRPMIV